MVFPRRLIPASVTGGADKTMDKRELKPEETQKDSGEMRILKMGRTEKSASLFSPISNLSFLLPK